MRPGDGSGPLVTAIWRAVPMLERIPDTALDEGPGEARAIQARTSEYHLCLLCGRERAATAVVCKPQEGEYRDAVWVDLCAWCFRAVRDELGDYGPPPLGLV